MSALLALIVLLQPSAAAAAARGAFDSARPAECGAQDGSRAANAWERAKEPSLRRYCDLLGSGTAKLVSAGPGGLVNQVPRIADEADKLLPGRAAPAILKGRAFLRLGKPAEALDALAEAKRRDDRALDDPSALLAWARANARTGHLKEAAQAYRAALPRTSQERSLASFEAGMTVMAAGGATIDDAVAMLRQARRDAQDVLQVAALAGLALALERAGERDEAKVVLAERGRGDAKAALGDPRVVEALADAGVPHELDALVAIAIEASDPAGAKDAWRKYLEGAGGKGLWADHAREHLGAAAKKLAPKSGAR